MAAGPTRAEFEKLTREIRRIDTRQEALSRELEIRVRRIAEVQADIDLIRSAWTKTNKPKRK